MKKILIIEDEPQQITAYQRKFGSVFNLLIAKNGGDGLALAKQKRPDLIILDIIMPGNFTGFDVLDQLKADEQTQAVPVIIVTNLDLQQKPLAIQKGAADFILKTDISLDELLVLVNKYLGMSKG